MKKRTYIFLTEESSPTTFRMIKESEYNGSPVVEFRKDEEDRFPFSFGVRKAKIILEHIEELKTFVEEHDT